MWCHLCTEDFSDIQAFKIHIIKEHKKSFEFRKELSESAGSECENVVIAEDDDKNTASYVSQANCCDSYLTIPAESDDAINISQENGYDSDNVTPINKLDDSTAALSTLSGKCYNVVAESNSDDKTVFLNNSLRIDYIGKDKTSVLKTSRKKQKLHKNTAKKSAVSVTISKKPKLSSILKKWSKKKKVAFSKKVLPERSVPVVSYKEDSPEHSDNNESNHSENLFNRDSNIINSQTAPISNSSESIPVNNNVSIFVANPYVGQSIDNYAVGNKAVQLPVYVTNRVSNSTSSKNERYFNFCSSNILKWLIKHKELCKNISYPLPPSFFNRVTAVHKAIFDCYCTASIREETSAVLKVYEELDCMIHKHINSINS